jgi:formylglycine-generating enzyme required for sulfatase activity
MGSYSALVGQVVHGCKVLDIVGEGGFAVVFEALHTQNGERVAIKCLKRPPDFSAESWGQFVEAFEEEGRLMQRLGKVQPGIVRVIGSGQCEIDGDRRPYLAMEWLDGLPLDRVIESRMRDERGPFSEAEALAIVEQLLLVLATAHGGLPDASGAMRIVAHRDIKPENLFLLASGDVPQLKLIDFGIAKVRGEGPERGVLQPGASTMFQAFSPMYAAPEQFARSYGEMGPWTDVYAVGLLLTELVTGRRALDGEDLGGFFVSTTAPARPTPRLRGASVSDAIEGLCQRALVVQPVGRYRDAGEMLADLRRLRGTVSQLSRRGASPPMRPGSGAFGRPNSPTPRVEQIVRTPTPPGTEHTPAPETAQSATTGPRAPRIVDPPAPLLTPARPRAPLVVALGAAGLMLGGLLLRALWPASSVASPQPASSSGILALSASDGGTSSVSTSVSASGAPSASAPDPDGASASAVGLPAVPSASGASAPRGMVRLEDGSIVLGAADGDPAERGSSAVQVAGFSLDRTEVTVEAYEVCVRAGVCATPRSYARCNWGHPAKRLHPINCVDAGEAAAFCAWSGKRLPTEEEWEFAARGGAEGRVYPWGNDPPRRQLCWSSDLTCEVGVLPEGRSRDGVLDLAGNVAEWTSTPYCPRNLPSCKTTRRAVHGGSFLDEQPERVRASARSAEDPAHHAIHLGFRCATGH